MTLQDPGQIIVPLLRSSSGRRHASSVEGRALSKPDCWHLRTSKLVDPSDETESHLRPLSRTDGHRVSSHPEAHSGGPCRLLANDLVWQTFREEAPPSILAVAGGRAVFACARSVDKDDQAMCRHSVRIRFRLSSSTSRPSSGSSPRRGTSARQQRTGAELSISHVLSGSSRQRETVTTAMVRGVRRCVGGRALLVSRNSPPSEDSWLVVSPKLLSSAWARIRRRRRRSSTTSPSESLALTNSPASQRRTRKGSSSPRLRGVRMVEVMFV